MGICDHLNSGDTPIWPTNFGGMTPPSSNAVVVMMIGGVAGPRPAPPPAPRPWPPPPWAIPGVAENAARANRTIRTVTILKTFVIHSSQENFLRKRFYLKRTNVG